MALEVSASWWLWILLTIASWRGGDEVRGGAPATGGGEARRQGEESFRGLHEQEEDNLHAVLASVILIMSLSVHR